MWEKRVASVLAGGRGGGGESQWAGPPFAQPLAGQHGRQRDYPAAAGGPQKRERLEAVGAAQPRRSRRARVVMSTFSPRWHKWYPLNPSLSHEMERLFPPAQDSYDAVMEEFRRNGHDTEYCPDGGDGDGAWEGGGRARGWPNWRLRQARSPLPFLQLPPSPATSNRGLSSVQLQLALGHPLRSLPLSLPTSASGCSHSHSHSPSLSLSPSPVGVCCAFCRNNGETRSFYMGHALKGADGRVLCPILRAYTCPHCGANGDRAHTIKYCPLASAAAVSPAPSPQPQPQPQPLQLLQPQPHPHHAADAPAYKYGINSCGTVVVTRRRPRVSRRTH